MHLLPYLSNNVSTLTTGFSAVGATLGIVVRKLATPTNSKIKDLAVGVLSFVTTTAVVGLLGNIGITKIEESNLAIRTQVPLGLFLLIVGASFTAGTASRIINRILLHNFNHADLIETIKEIGHTAVVSLALTNFSRDYAFLEAMKTQYRMGVSFGVSLYTGSLVSIIFNVLLNNLPPVVLPPLARAELEDGISSGALGLES